MDENQKPENPADQPAKQTTETAFSATDNQGATELSRTSVQERQSQLTSPIVTTKEPSK